MKITDYQHSTKHTRIIEVHTKEQEQIIRHFSIYYKYELSVFDKSFTCPPDGLYVHDGILKCLKKDNNRSYLLLLGEEPVGFSFVECEDNQPDYRYSIPFFFIIRRFQKKGLGYFFATHLFNKFSGKWMLAQSLENIPAMYFWRKTIEKFTGNSPKELRRDIYGIDYPMNVMYFSV